MKTFTSPILNRVAPLALAAILAAAQPAPASEYFTARQQAELYATVLRLTDGDGTGSGVCIAYDEPRKRLYVATAYHCVDSGRQLITAESFSPSSGASAQVLRDGRVVAYSRATDVAIVLFEPAPRMPTANVCPLNLLPSRFRGLSIGCARGSPPIINESSVVLDSSCAGLSGQAWMVDRYVIPGESGGPLFDTRGLVVGLAVRTDHPERQRGWYSGPGALPAVMAEAGIAEPTAAVVAAAPVWEFLIVVFKLIAVGAITARRRS